MEASAEPRARLLMDKDTFLTNYCNEQWPNRTCLCHQVESFIDDTWVPLEDFNGFLLNQSENRGLRLHAERLLLDQVSSWGLDPNQQHRLTCYISWSPCEPCASELAAFLGEHQHMSLRIFAARIYSKSKYEEGLRKLQAAGAQIHIMSLEDFKYCWDTFVQCQEQAFQPWERLVEISLEFTGELQDILQNQEM